MSNKEKAIPKLLIVDDNTKNLISMKKVLFHLPVIIDVASSGQEALRKVLRTSYAVIFLDVQMPEMDGFEVARFMSQNETTATIPIVFVTAIHQEEKYIIEGYESGGIDYISKPVNPQVLIGKTKIFLRLFEQQRMLNNTISKLNHLANNDALTGLPNRHHFNQISTKILAFNARKKRQFAILLLDLDNFKSVNDTLGHDFGDALLIEVSLRLKQAVRQADHISRLGGDEFVVLLPEVEQYKEACMVASNIIETLSQPFHIENNIIKTSTSIGIAFYPVASKDLQGLLKCADIALYRAKDKGKNKFEIFTKSINKTYLRRVKIESLLQKGIENKEFHLSYQPRYNILENKISGVEALARWSSSELGVIQPTEFIAVAEDSGNIEMLSKHIMTLALKQFLSWYPTLKARNIGFAINLSPYQVMNASFVHNLNVLFDEVGIDSTTLSLELLEFELTEALFKGEQKHIEASLNFIKELNIKLAIDDFGTGYSSLSRLKLLPINILKIDKSFIGDIIVDNNDAAIVQAIISLAKTMNLDVIAEGVETKAQVDFLLKNKCHQIQGKYYNMAMSRQDFEVLLNQK